MDCLKKKSSGAQAITIQIWKIPSLHTNFFLYPSCQTDFTKCIPVSKERGQLPPIGQVKQSK